MIWLLRKADTVGNLARVVFVSHTGSVKVLLSCVAYETLRKDFISKLHSKSHIKVSSSMLNSVILKRILNSKNPNVLRMLVKYIV